MRPSSEANIQLEVHLKEKKKLGNYSAAQMFQMLFLSLE